MGKAGEREVLGAGDDRAAQVVSALQWSADGRAIQAIERAAPEETAIGVSYDSEPYAVLMATPADVADLALGFTVSERIADADDVLDVRIGVHDEGLVADVLLSQQGARRARERRRRNLEGRSSCGLCGVQSPEDATRALPRLPDGLVVEANAVFRALGALRAAQILGNRTRATHAAAWADASGTLRLVREDVGRHNALDKMIGGAHRAGLAPGEAFVVITSRCSYEMVEKAAVAGIAMIVAISAPTALAVRKAEAANMTLVALARADGYAAFSGRGRLATALSGPAPGTARCRS
jgi:FdhD protein